MRIVGGKMKGRVLAGPGSNKVRPTSDRLRETIFDILAHRYGDPVEGARVLDLFAGTGAMAIEALSRGARFALLVDESAEAQSIVRANIEALGLAGTASVLRRDVTRLGVPPDRSPFDLAFLDPPYGRGLVPPTLDRLLEGRWLGKGALVVVEETKGAEVRVPEGLAHVETRGFSETQVVFLRVDRA
jgi:16S rRNA (guanine966-N2)-methyltransferase